MDKAVSRLHTVWVDGGFDGNPFMLWVTDVCRWVVQVVLRLQRTKGFVMLKKRWVVEHTVGCIGLNLDYECLPASAKAFTYIAMIRLMLRRLA